MTLVALGWRGHCVCVAVRSLGKKLVPQQARRYLYVY